MLSNRVCSTTHPVRHAARDAKRNKVRDTAQRVPLPVYVSNWLAPFDDQKLLILYLLQSPLISIGIR
eukprot:COSAG03_NODE_22418_length_291_cov_0.828125_1_plen_66_part_10